MTVVAVHQPNFLPYPGFFYKMHLADVFILYDTAQYSKNEYHNRNRIKTPQGAAWLTVPVKSPGLRPIGAVEIDNARPWQKRLWQTIEANYLRAPHFEEYGPLFRRVFFDRGWRRLLDLNVELIEVVRKAMDLTSETVHASELPPPRSSDPTKKLIEMIRSIGGTVYLSGPGASVYIDSDRFDTVSLEIARMPGENYQQLWGPFIPNLSILDPLLNCGPDTRRMLFGA